MEKRLLIVRKYGGFGGIEHQIETITSGLIAQGWQVYFFSDRQSPLSDSLAGRGAHVTWIPFEGFLKTAKAIRELCRKHQISIIQSHMLKESFYCRLAKLLMPSLHHVFRVHTYIDCSHISSMKKRCYHLAGFISDFLVDRYVSINEYNVREMRARTHISGRKIVVARNAVRYLEPQDQACPYKNGHIAMIANFVDFKGHDVLLEGLKILRDLGHPVVAHLIGGVPGQGTANEDRRRLDIVEQTIRADGLEDLIAMDGYQENMAKALSQCGMVVLPSDSEGTPNVLLEGMLLNKIVVASSVGGVPEFVVEGKTGFLHLPQDAQAFAQALMRAYNTPDDQLQKIADNAKRTVCELYSAERLINDLQSVYHTFF